MAINFPPMIASVSTPKAIDAITPMPRHLRSLDALRGLGALCVVFWHWQHFLGPPGGFDPASQPLYAILRPFYTHGYKAVFFFFTLSGFIFYWLYGPGVASGKTSIRDFAVKRFSRLYPLHIATLLLVAFAQWAYFARHGHPFNYPDNDGVQFARQLAFASFWPPNPVESFNGPAWSVSVEVLLYLAFFVTARLGLNRWWHLAAFAGLALAAIAFRIGPDRLPPAFLGFFAGGIAYHLVERLHGVRRSFWMASSLAILAIGLQPVIPGAARTAYLQSIIFPLAIASVALFECRWGPFGGRLQILGEISYSSYLLHFPLQLAIVSVGGFLAVGSPFYRHPASLAIFFLVLVPLSLLAYRRFEKPAQDALRAHLLRRATVGISLRNDHDAKGS